MAMSLIFQGEGAAYRGRVLVEIETELNPSHNEERGSLNSDDIADVAVQLKLFSLNLFSERCDTENLLSTDA